MRSPDTARRSRLIAVRVAVAVIAVAPLALAVPGLIDAATPGEPGDGRRAAATAPDEPPPPRSIGAATSAPAFGPDRRAELIGPERFGRPLRGFALVAHHIGDIALYRASIDRIADLGGDTLSIVTPMFQERIDSSSIRVVPDRCPTDAQLVELLRYAGARGLHTLLQPIVLIEHPEDGEWRGRIRPDDWDAWWSSYAAMIDRALAIADAAPVDLLAIGSELNSTEAQLDRWREIVRRVRTRYRGPVTYSANWDRYDRTTIWQLVDVITVSAYFELRTDDEQASVADLVDAWAEPRDRMLGWARDWQKPLLLGEVGFPSLPWATAHPWNYVGGPGQTADHEAQARGYRALFAAWTDAMLDPREPTLGVVCYHWNPYAAGGPRDIGYGVAGKPAEAVVRGAFASLRPREAAPPRRGSP